MMDTKWVLMTNDDGIDAPGFELLVKAMNKAGIPLVAFAPSGNKSACSMQLNLGKPHRSPQPERVDSTMGP